MRDERPYFITYCLMLHIVRMRDKSKPSLLALRDHKNEEDLGSQNASTSVPILLTLHRNLLTVLTVHLKYSAI